MQDTKVRSRRKAQVTKFTLELRRPEQAAAELCGQDVVRHPGESGREAEQHCTQSEGRDSLIKTEDRLSRNLKAEEVEGHLSERLASLGSRRVEANTVLCLELRDVRKEGQAAFCV